MMRVGIVGAGLAGLGAARTLRGAGHEVVIFEGNSSIGGRCCTERLGEFLFDTGCTSIAPRSPEMESAMHEISTEGLVRIQESIYTHNSFRIGRGDISRDPVRRFTYVQGNQVLCERLGEGIDIRLNSFVNQLVKDDDGFDIAGERFARVILATPPPVSAQILATLGEKRPLDNVSYRKCLSIQLGYDVPTPDVSYHAIVDPEQRHPLTWLSLESKKCQGRAPEGGSAFVMQMSSGYSREHFDAAAEIIVRDGLEFLERLFGPRYRSPVVSSVARWKYSLPENLAMFSSVNRPNSKVLLASDGLLGGRTELAYAAGAQAARMILEESS